MAAATARAEIVRTRINGPPGCSGKCESRGRRRSRRALAPGAATGVCAATTAPESRRRKSRCPSLHEASSPMGRSARRCGARGYADRGEGGARPGGREADGEGGRQDLAEDLGDRRIGRNGNVGREGGDQDGRRRQACDAFVRRRLDGGGRREFERSGGRRGSGRFRVQAEGAPSGTRARRRTGPPGSRRERRIRRSIILSKPSGRHCIPVGAGDGAGTCVECARDRLPGTPSGAGSGPPRRTARPCAGGCTGCSA